MPRHWSPRLYIPVKPVLSEANTGGTDYAELGTRFKASHVKILLYWLAMETEQASSAAPTDVTLHVLATCCYFLQRVVELLDQAGLVLDASEAEEACKAVHAHLKCYAWLALKAHDLRLPLFRVRPKTHYLYHIGDAIKRWRINFNAFHVFDEESFLGKIKSIAVKVHGATLTQRVFERYCLCLALYLHQQKLLEEAVE